MRLCLPKVFSDTATVAMRPAHRGMIAKLYSIGEEQGPGYAKQLAWSPLGASRYRRCLLAVVSTNHKLYIFEPVGHVAGDMRLVHDLTPLISDYGGLPSGEGEEVEDVARKRLRARCKSIAWSPPCRIDGNRWGESFVAIGNDFLEIVLLRFFFYPLAFDDWEGRLMGMLRLQSCV